MEVQAVSPYEPLGLLARQKPQRPGLGSRPPVPPPQKRPSRRPRANLLLGFIIGAIFMGAASFLAVATQGGAWQPLPARWSTSEIGYLSDPDLAGYVSAGMQQWASASGLHPYPGGGDIQVVFGPLAPPILHGHQSAQANVSFYGDAISFCEVRVDREKWFALNEFGRQNVLTHELGHCLGLNHSDQPGVMMNPTFYGFSSDDAAGIAALYPRTSLPTPAPIPPTPTVVPVTTTVVDQPPLVFQPGPAPVIPTVAAGAARAQAVSTSVALAPPPAAAAQPPAPRPFAGELAAGWSYVVWTGNAVDSAACGCDAVLLLEGAAWRSWYASSPEFLNTLDSLVPGTAYWVFKQ
ncbi:MAG: matrixin family metalloprotease [Dehalococcoidia bacterium]|nr:matrixin family metalloprotease [Dehalococcoidia bacterium]MCB9484917.1 matrixin family metalloprotease [Thermoflexaceae bacterium]